MGCSLRLWSFSLKQLGVSECFGVAIPAETRLFRSNVLYVQIANVTRKSRLAGVDFFQESLMLHSGCFCGKYEFCLLRMLRPKLLDHYSSTSPACSESLALNAWLRIRALPAPSTWLRVRVLSAPNASLQLLGSERKCYTTCSLQSHLSFVGVWTDLAVTI